ncbi:MAG: HNH endonuclease signature motif containing protein, partial [Actinomycetota bacterium]
LRRRDRGCTFPGCDARWFLHTHHIWHWGRGGPTDLDNLVLACTSHHKLVHEYGWDVRLGPNDVATWFKPDGTRFAPCSFERGDLASAAVAGTGTCFSRRR